MRIVSEQEFSNRLRFELGFQGIWEPLTEKTEVGCVTGPGRSGAIAAVYASHLLRVPFIPYGQKAPPHLGRLLIIDTASLTGKTIRKAAKKYESARPMALVLFDEKDPAIGRVAFWYEASKPQHYRHELPRRAA